MDHVKKFHAGIALGSLIGILLLWSCAEEGGDEQIQETEEKVEIQEKKEEIEIQEKEKEIEIKEKDEQKGEL